MKDLRTLCPRCRADYIQAGYRLRLVPGNKEPCDKCQRPGRTFELEEKMLKACKYCGRIHAKDFDCGKRPVRHKYSRSEEEAGRYTYAFAQKSQEIKERQHFLCPICLERGIIRSQPLETHHIIKLRERPDLLLEDANLIALCELDHKKADAGEIDPDYLHALAAKRDGKCSPPRGEHPFF